MGQGRLQQDAAQGGRDLLVVFEDVVLQVARVAAEELVATVAGEDHLIAGLPAHPGAVVAGDDRGVGIGLVIGARELRQHRQNLLWADQEDLVLQAELPGGDFGITRLVEFGMLKGDGDAAPLAGIRLGEKAGQGAAVEAAAQEARGLVRVLAL